jgi:hypothetical protein
MIKSFQLECLKVLARESWALRLIDDIDGKAMFDFSDYHATFELLKGYKAKYNSEATRPGLLQFLDDTNQHKPINPKSYLSISNTVKTVFTAEVEANEAQVREKLIQYAQRKMSKDVLKEFTPRLEEGTEIYKEIITGLNRVLDLERVEEKEKTGLGGGGLIAGHDSRDFSDVILSGKQTKYKGLNRLLNIGGFEAPELQVFVAKEKFGKTAVMLDWAIWYMACGYKMYYADFENGKKPLMMRLYQTLMQVEEVKTLLPENRRLMNEMIRWHGMRGGEIELESFSAHVSTVADIDTHQHIIQKETGIEFDGNCYDYADLIAAIDPNKRVIKRHNIQAVYHDLINMQKARNQFGITITQIKNEAHGKKFYIEGDVEEDKAKSKNCHGMYGMPQTKTEELAGVFRIHPVAVRRGKPFGLVYCRKNLAIGRIEEITKEEWEDAILGVGDNDNLVGQID